MDLREFLHRSSELRHPWEIARKEFIVHLTRSRFSGSQPLQALDVGAGDTWLARRLYKALPNGSWMTCMDQHYSGETLTKLNPKVPVQLTNSLEPGRLFDAVFMLDVLEHVENEEEFLRRILAHANSSALIWLSAPAFPCLFCAHDRELAHRRRYTRAGLQRLLRSQGLEILDGGGLFFSLLPLRALQKLAELAGWNWAPAGVKDWTAGSLTTKLLTMCLIVDWRAGLMLRRFFPLPGLSWWFLCRKP